MTTGRPSSAARLAHSFASPCLVVSTYSEDSRSTRLRTASRMRAILPRLAAGLRITRGLLEGVVVSIVVLLHKATYLHRLYHLLPTSTITQYRLGSCCSFR